MKNVNQKRRSVGKLYCHSIREEQCSSLKSRFALNLCIFKYFQYLLQILSKLESGDSIPIGNFKFLHLGCERSEEGIKFLFREKDVDNNKQRIRSIEKQNFYFHHPLPSSVQPRRVRIYGTNEKENHAGGKKKKNKKREGGGSWRKTTALRGLSNFSFTLVNPRNALSRRSHQSRNVPGPAATPRTT